MKLTKEKLIENFNSINDYSAFQKTFSPCYSNIGFEIEPENCGSGALWLHYNRASRKLWDTFLDFPLKQNKAQTSAFSVAFGENETRAKLTFTDTDTIYFSADGLDSVKLFAKKNKKLRSFWIEKISENEAEVFGYSENTDDRDPDETVPFYIYLKASQGEFFADKNDVIIRSNSDKKIIISAAVEVLNIDRKNAQKKAKNSPENFSEAEEKCREFYLECFRKFDLNISSEREEKIIAKAAYGLTANLAKAPGKLSKHISSFPSRGSYPTHFLWDTCFQNLAYENFSPALAADFLLQIAAFQRSDGKFPQFMCSTWERPHYSQPALVGWAAMRIAARTNDRKFIEDMTDAIEKNNLWWLNSRNSECGLISCPHGLETGQDDSPRFDNGTTFACDMNSYVLHQLHSAAALNRMIGRSEKAIFWEKKAEKLSQKIIEILWCEEDGIFYDVSPESGEFVRIVSPVSFLPLWAGVNLPKEKAAQSIEKYLLNPDYLFGEIPFPSVAYNDINYGSDKWWRGPTWMPNAYLMLETLDKLGYEKEYYEAAERLYRVILNDGELHELFDSKTGTGLGAAEQGWTNAIFIKLCSIVNRG